MTGPAVRLRGVWKAFGATQALVAVDLDIERGTVHGLVGQNGAGKSTLGKIISGTYERDSGDLLVFGEPTTRWSPRVALEHGVAMIHQELSLVPELTVAENVFLGLEERRLGLLTGNETVRFEALNERAGFRIRPTSRVGSLRFADRQKVEILRALARDAQLIVMDEPTSALSPDETEHLHAVIRRLGSEGRTVVYISHFLDDVLSVCTYVTSMRDGRIVRTAPASQETEETLVTAMLGRSLDITFPERRPVGSPGVTPILRVDGLRALPSVLDVSFDVRPGEIVGLAGLVGSGRSETLRVLFGADPADGGAVLVDGRPYGARSPLASVGLGIGMIPEDRRSLGLVGTLSAGENISLPSVGRYASRGLIDRAAERRDALGMMRQLAVVPDRFDEDIATLSGGNQQKVLFGKWLATAPRLLLLDEPTKGIDVGAKKQIYEFVVELAARGMGIVLVSSELEEVMGLAHRVFLIRGGRTLDMVDPVTVSLDEVLLRLFGLADQRSAA